MIYNNFLILLKNLCQFIMVNGSGHVKIHYLDGPMLEWRCSLTNNYWLIISDNFRNGWDPSKEDLLNKIITSLVIYEKQIDKDLSIKICKLINMKSFI